MLLSLVTGTYNRYHYLRLMIASVRRQLRHGLDYEFVIVDGGSTDGTLDYLRAQPDVHLIEDGRLTGAISAFCRGAEAAQGEYVLLANDDVIFKPHSLLAALQHLETHPGCGAVAFADNRTSILTGNGLDYRTEGIGCTLPDGSKSMVTYAQVGMFRRGLGHEAGWWGWQDPIMSKARTYGGDSYLSAKLWEMAYTVDPVEGAVVDDLIVRDSLRDANGAPDNRDSAAYYERFPTVQLPDYRRGLLLAERLRILYLPIYEVGQTAIREAWMGEALSEYGLCLEVDYLNTDVELVGLVNAWQPDVILTQIQGIGPKLTAQHLAAMRRACPTTLIVNINGDAHESGLISVPMIDLLRHVDLQLTVNAKVLPEYERQGIQAGYWQTPFFKPTAPLPDAPQWDVLFNANWYEYRTPLFDTVYSLPYHVGVYGNDRRASGNCHYDFAMQAALYAKATVVIGDTFPNTEGFVSNRLVQVLSSGGFLLQQFSLNLDRWMGVVPGVHYVEWTTLDDLREKIAYWVQPARAEERKRIAQQGMEFVRENFSCAVQTRKLFTELIPKIAEREYN